MVVTFSLVFVGLLFGSIGFAIGRFIGQKSNSSLGEIVNFTMNRDEKSQMLKPWAKRAKATPRVNDDKAAWAKENKIHI